jgi:hypothetical protein
MTLVFFKLVVAGNCFLCQFQAHLFLGVLEINGGLNEHQYSFSVIIEFGCILKLLHCISNYSNSDKLLKNWHE